MPIKTMTTEEIKKGKSKTDWAKIDAMTDKKIDSGIATDPDTYELTDEEFDKLKYASEIIPKVVKAYKRTRGAQKAPTKESITIRLDADVVDFFKSRGKGWQVKINDALLDFVNSH